MRGLYGFIEGGLGGGFVFVCNDYIMLFKAWVAAISEMFTLIFYLVTINWELNVDKYQIKCDSKVGWKN